MPPSHTIRLQGRTVAYSIRQSGRARRAGLRVGADGLSVQLPKGASLKRVEPLIRTHEDWVLKQLDKLAARERDARLWMDGTPALLYRGEAVAIRRGPALKRVTLAGDAIVVQRHLANPAEALEQWLRAECRAALRAPIAEAEAKTGKRNSGVTIRGQKTRWGSCSASGGLSFNWRLIQAPPHVLDYVACHEVAHLSVPNHSAPFWALVEDICPHMTDSRQWLRDHQHRLMMPLDSLFEDMALSA